MRFLGPQKIPAIQVLIAVIFDLKSAYSRTINMLLKELVLFRKPRYSRLRYSRSPCTHYSNVSSKQDYFYENFIPNFREICYQMKDERGQRIVQLV